MFILRVVHVWLPNWFNSRLKHILLQISLIINPRRACAERVTVVVSCVCVCVCVCMCVCVCVCVCVCLSVCLSVCMSVRTRYSGSTRN